MTRKTQTFHLILFLAALAGLSRIVTGSLIPPTGDASIWFHGGLLMLILGMYWIEPFFTKPSDVVVNCLVVFISTSTLNSPPHEMWWSALRFMSLGILVAAFLVVWLGSPALPGYDSSRVKRIVYLLVIHVGNATALFSAVFLLALFSYYDAPKAFPYWMLAFWGCLLVVKNLDLEGLLTDIIKLFRNKPTKPVGRLTRFAEPNIARFELGGDSNCSRGTLVAFTQHGELQETSPLAIVVAHRSGPTRVEAEALLVESGFAEGTLDRRQVIIKVDQADPRIRERLQRSSLGNDLESLIGFASRESDISTLQFEMRRGISLEEGQLVSAISLSGSHVLFQVTNGVLHEEASLEAGERSFTVGEAQQLGTWDGDRQGFSSHSWVVPENAPIVRNSSDIEFRKILKPGLVDVGHVPSSSYPVNLNLHNLVLFHSAILGVTGSGKSFLSYFLVEKCAEAGIKVLCLDLTGDYQRYVRGGVRLTSSASISPFLDEPDSRIGIVEFTETGTHPITATKAIAQVALEWCRKHRSPDEIRDPKPKILLVLEEGHSLVPEWNSNPVPTLRETVNSTAQIALQARKYGLGFMVVTQRTANVTKSILNQCNTIIAFQAYDETGFEFMKNYMGLHHVQSLPNLKKRQGVLVGKASTSDRPLIVRFHDQDRQPTTVEMPAYVARKDPRGLPDIDGAPAPIPAPKAPGGEPSRAGV